MNHSVSFRCDRFLVAATFIGIFFLSSVSAQNSDSELPEVPGVLDMNAPPEFPTPEEFVSENLRPDNGPSQTKSSRDLMYEAMVNVQDELFEEAIPKLEKVIEDDPTLIGAWEALGWAYWQTGRQEEAGELWTQLVEIAPNEPLGYNLLAQLATRDLEMSKARDLYLKSLELNPAQYETRLSLAQVLLWSGSWSEAVNMLKDLFEEEPERLDVQIELAWGLYGLEQYEESLRNWNDIIEVIPDQPGFLLARANVHLLMGLLDEAAVDAQAVLEVQPENIDAMNILVSLSTRRDQPYQTVSRLDDLISRAENLENKVRVAEKKAMYMADVHEQNPDIFSLNEVLEVAEETWDLDRTVVGTGLFYAEALVRSGFFQRAIEVADYILEESNPNNQRARWVKFEGFMGLQQLDLAEKQLIDNLRSFNPENPFRHAYWSRLYFARGDFQEALNALDRLEREGAKGAVFGMLYHALSPSEFSDRPSVREVREQLMTLKRNGFTFITSSEIPEYFESTEDPPPTELDRPWLNQVVEGVKYSWTGEKQAPELLSDFRPEMKVMVAFDDGLRSSFKHGTLIAREVEAKFTMFIGIGDVIARGQRYISNFKEIREYMETGYWEVQSHLWDAGQLFPIEPGEDGKRGLPLTNRLWLEADDRMETLREYQQRIRKEFAQSKAVLSRELEIPIDDLDAVAYPYGEIGQELSTNIDLFNVIRVIMNEAEISYTRGFVQNQFGYIVKGDNPLLYKRYEPSVGTSGREVLREAYLQHPVFHARHMRAEIAALQGKYDMAMKNVELLRRDGYPEEELRDLTDFVDRNLARLVTLPDAVEDTATQEERLEKKTLFQLEDPYIGVDGRSVRANELIDEREFGIFAGVNLNRRTTLQARISEGEIDQSFTTGTNRVVEVFRSVTGDATRNVQRIIDGQTIRARETTSITESFSFSSNSVDRVEFEAEFEHVQGQMSYIHDSGSFTIARVGIFDLNLIDRRRQESEVTYGIEHQWRPFPVLDFLAAYDHGVVPSARELISYDRVVLRPIWRVRDWWQASGDANFSFYNDDNSFVNTEVENLFLLSDRLDVWAGLHHSISTADEESDLYWSPFWEQRHFLILEIRRNFPDFTTSFRGHLGFQKERARSEDIQEFLNLEAAAQEQGGFAAGEPPDEGWNRLLGFSADIVKRWENGFELNGSFLVNATNEYVEHNVIASFLYRF